MIDLTKPLVEATQPLLAKGAIITGAIAITATVITIFIYKKENEKYGGTGTFFTMLLEIIINEKAKHRIPALIAGGTYLITALLIFLAI